MNSPFANAFLHIQEIIAAIYVDPEAVTPVQLLPYSDMDYGQLEVKDRPAVSFPCVLIDFKGWVFTELSKNVQQGEGMIILKLATDPYSSTSSITPDDYKEAALTIFDMEQRLYEAFEGMAINVDGTNKTVPLSRTNLDSDNRRPGIKVLPLTFTTSFQDYSAKKAQRTTPRPPMALTDNNDIPI